ncbi:MAG: hypothetical protein UR39_C0004G0017 [Candidatus Woesebacteria bacterium GW2011_GWA1_33_30]|uniref:Uncharacterized protein n=1 Tax=Candidatus Woesebacteria bacterium GW2011_GWA2_33_28 TaxID=1618561 RepID=A0A0F9ZT64_9BACT|nr:MAG: hypothetical protein UR38_C0004G0056 [Candidatus Woesebacteria bacterium GW2011_GWA2_33_28]KKP48396.1 MAG: hypothetical protein UR39_C0004G0017 [Candidatus Woesebacteria bacterium GW2011_GWA1_33_30]KKP49503.1 MAG: hypothetical protein UR40_C0005G0017 [Microgenomates group bacterium GW2011_GWC1_33_32]KKP52468.1 MAG: hypothetical protein UR44_C0002G0017 [Candidatus Woesebacteria bacterium GW2011_GWB1_33_38]KKP58326.1 MAG: hypothetical protein UR48_C0005G0004 [Microgenomates group bacteriu
MKKLEKASIAPLVIILLSIIVVFLISRIGSFLVLTGILPWYLFANINGFRLHHFVYGNILITITSFFAIGLGIRKHKNWFALFYGIGLGLVLDEFVLWMGDISQLTSYVLFIPYSLTAITVASLIIATIIMVRLYKK